MARGSGTGRSPAPRPRRVCASRAGGQAGEPGRRRRGIADEDRFQLGDAVGLRSGPVREAHGASGWRVIGEQLQNPESATKGPESTPPGTPEPRRRR